MILYILISYVVMAIYTAHKACETKKAKSWFKLWLVSPLSMPIVFVINFINW